MGPLWRDLIQSVWAALGAKKPSASAAKKILAPPHNLWACIKENHPLALATPTNLPNVKITISTTAPNAGLSKETPIK